VTDFMPVNTPGPVVMRQVSCLGGMMRLHFTLNLRFDWGYVRPRTHRSGQSIVMVCGQHLVALHSTVPVNVDEQRGLVSAEFDIREKQQISFALTYGPSHEAPPAAPDMQRALADTSTYWKNWAGQFQRKTPWREAVVRSLLTLKALTYHPTGSLVAAATTSLPETPGESLNWDYRYCWLRDATFTLSAFLNAGFQEEAQAWRDWMLRAIAAAPDKMRIMYRVDGDRRMNEWVPEWLSGYEGATPVRVGNSAADQEQIDVVGELLDSIELMARAGLPSTPLVLVTERELLDHLERTWRDKGHGLWESRSRPQHYTYSKVMAWVGVDRFIRHHTARGDLEPAMLERLDHLRARIHQQVLTYSWHHQRGHFVDRYGGERLDASLLLLPLVNFLPADDPRMAATIDAIERELSHEGLVWRKAKGQENDQGAFIACSCWLADCRGLQGRRDAAAAVLEKVLSLRNDVGLLSEEYHPGMRRLMGNYPQALSHLAVVNTALGLSGPVLQRGGG
jgi:GH15 family glucan-1,4-alpha-glucosidase